MLNLQKYLSKAEVDPDFKEKLLKDANQAIKDEFGEKIPYKLTCHKKIVFEVEEMDSLSDTDAISVAGGSLNPTLIPFDEDWFFGPNPAIYDVTFHLPSPASGSTGSISYVDVIEPGRDPLSIPNRSQLGARHNVSLIRGEDGGIYITGHTTHQPRRRWR